MFVIRTERETRDAKRETVSPLFGMNSCCHLFQPVDYSRSGPQQQSIIQPVDTTRARCWRLVDPCWKVCVPRLQKDYLGLSGNRRLETELRVVHRLFSGDRPAAGSRN